MCRFLSIFFVSILIVFSLSFAVGAIDVSASYSVLIECDSLDVVFEKNANLPVGMASTTKIMTAIVALESEIPLDKVVKIPKEAIGIEGSSIYLKDGEELTIEDLLYALLLESANDAAVALAIACYENVDNFVSKMNEKAADLGLTQTHFTNPHGLDDAEHYTTATELAKIAIYAMKNPVFSEIVSTQKRVIPLFDDGSRVLINHNKLLKSCEGVNGIKTGFTKKCGRCLVSSCERDGVKMVAVTLKAPNDWLDHKNLYDYGFSLYENIKLANAGDYQISLSTVNGSINNVLCSNLEGLNITLKRGDNNISAELEANRLVPAPISQGDYLGQVVFKNNGKIIGKLGLYALYDVKEINYKKSIFEGLFK